jgi:CRISPR-associated protein (Cas_Csm6)
MASIVLSFVGNQDPFARNDTEGSIVTLIKHLLASQRSISRLVLLHTTETERNAEDTKAWLSTTLLNLPDSAIALIPVSEALSDDPINHFLAAKEARQVIDHLRSTLLQEDYLECNASSGTPAMKNAWGILQASGYTNNIHIWQVRNPDKLSGEQSHVFRDDVNALKNEFDLKIIKQQVADYNYSGALISLRSSNLKRPSLESLLNYGHCRSVFDFNRADQSIQLVKSVIDQQWFQEIATLRQRSYPDLARECYFNAQTKLNNQAYAEFLVLLSSFQETSLRALIFTKVSVDLRTGKNRRPDTVWSELQAAENGNLIHYLQQYRMPNGKPLTLSGFVTVPVMMAILERYADFSTLLPVLKNLKNYVDDRNDLVHRLEGVSEIQDLEQLQNTLKTILKAIAPVPKQNPFDRLNQQLYDLLDQAIQTV